MTKKVYVDLSKQDVQDIINAYEKDIEKFNKQKEVLDKIKEFIEDEFVKLGKGNDYMLRKIDLKELLEILEEIDE